MVAEEMALKEKCRGS